MKAILEKTKKLQFEDLSVGDYIRFKDKVGNTYIRKISKLLTKEQNYDRWPEIYLDKPFGSNKIGIVSLKNILKYSNKIEGVLELGDIVDDLNRTVVTIEAFEQVKYNF